MFKYFWMILESECILENHFFEPLKSWIILVHFGNQYLGILASWNLSTCWKSWRYCRITVHLGKSRSWKLRNLEQVWYILKNQYRGIPLNIPTLGGHEGTWGKRVVDRLLIGWRLSVVNITVWFHTESWSGGVARIRCTNPGAWSPDSYWPGNTKRRNCDSDDAHGNSW